MIDEAVRLSVENFRNQGLKLLIGFVFLISRRFLLKKSKL